MAAASRNNVVNALRRHDWVYRWERVLDSVGLPHTEAMRERRRRLGALADAVAAGAPDSAAEEATVA
jgi:hypothetical protein